MLGISLYGGGLDSPASPRGLKLIDITVPSQPVEIGFYPTGPGGLVLGQLFSGAIHFDFAKTPTGRTLALLSTPGSEFVTSNAGAQPGVGDLQIVDISDPTRPILVGEWGVLDEPSMGRRFFEREQRGARADGFAESVHASADGRRAYIAYSDHGAIILDISNPSRPRLIGHAGFGSRKVEGAAFDLRPAADDTLLIRSHLARVPFQVRLSSNVYPGVRTAGEATATPPIYNLEEHSIDGEVVFIGRGCPGDVDLADTAGKIALITADGCTQNLKTARAQLAGATAVILYDDTIAGTDRQFPPGAGGVVTMPDGTQVTIQVPAIGVGNNTGRCLAQTRDQSGAQLASRCVPASPVTVHGLAIFQGFGRVDFFNIENPAAPLRLSTFATPSSLDLDGALTNRFPNPPRSATANYLAIVGNLAFISWEQDGLRVVDFSDPADPREVAVWNGEGRPTGSSPIRAWQVVRHREFILLHSLSERKVYILRVVGSTHFGAPHP